MSPVIRKWGMRGTVLLSAVSIAMTGTMLTMASFGQGVDAAEIANPESWFKWSEKFGFPLVALVALLLLAIWSTRAVWTFLKPLLESIVGDYRAMVRKQGEFAENANTLLTKSVASDETNGIMIRETHGLVKEIHGEIVK